MTIELSFEDRQSHLYAKLQGAWEAEATEDTLHRVKEAASARGRTRILLDCLDFFPPRSEFTRFLGGKALAEIFGAQYRIAAVSRAERITGFAETVAVNRGARVFVTHDESEALKWLHA